MHFENTSRQTITLIIQSRESGHNLRLFRNIRRSFVFQVKTSGNWKGEFYLVKSQTDKYLPSVGETQM